MTDAEAMRNCPKCGKSIKAAATRCVWCFEKIEPVREAASRADPKPNVVTASEAKQDTASTDRPAHVVPAIKYRTNRDPNYSPYTNTIVHRYRDAYAVASDIVQQGQWLKTLAVIAAVIFAGLGLLLAIQLSGRLALAAIIAGAVVASGAYVTLHSLGVRIAAEGQQLLASLDTAVNTSPFLDASDKAQAMSL